MNFDLDSKSVFLNFSLWLHFIGVNARSIKKNKTNYILGFFGCFLVVFVVAVMATILANAPLIFLRLAELQEGEADAIITPGQQGGNSFGSRFQFLNYTQVSRVLGDKSENISPRRQIPVIVYPSRQCLHLNPNDNNWKYGQINQTCVPVACFKANCGIKTTTQIGLIVMDTEKEKKIGFGRTWSEEPIKEGECYVHGYWAQKNNIKVGDTIYLEISTISLFGRPTNMHIDRKSYSLFNTYSKLYISVKVAKEYWDPKGKHSNTQNNVMMVEYNNWISHVKKNLPRDITSDDKELVQNYNLYDYASTIAINLPYPRTEAYMSSNYDEIHQSVIEFMSPIFFKIGWNRIVTTLPILENLQVGRVVSMFLGLILNIIIFVLLFLSVILIYSLLMVNVDRMTFEIGVMRMIGSQKSGIIMILLVQAFYYAIPAWIVAIIFAQIALPIVSAAVQYKFGIFINSYLSFKGVMIATCLGFVVPVVSSIFPIRTALGKNLHDSLDTRKSKTAAVKIDIERADPTSSISYGSILVGAALSILGGSVYYTVPLALLSMNISLLLNVFFFLLISMLLGLVMLSLNFQGLTERIIVNLFLFWEKKPIRTILLKNLISHSERNRKTAVMYALSLGFIIFISVAASLQVQTIEYQKQSSAGALHTFQGGAWLNNNANDLESFVKRNDKIKSFAWYSNHLQQILDDVSEVKTMNLGKLAEMKRTRVYAITPSFFKTTINGFLSIESSLFADEEIGAALYQEPMSALVSSVAKDILGLSLGDYFVVDLKGNVVNQFSESTKTDTQKEFFVKLKVVGFLNHAPCFTFSPFPLINNQALLVSFPTMLNLTLGKYKTVDEIPLSTMLIERADYLNEASVMALRNELQEKSEKNGAYSYYDYDSDAATLDIPKQALQLIFSFTTLVAMVISFFSLVSSMNSNIYEQSKEIAILRALGVDKLWMYRIYIYESFVLVMSSSTLGMVIGYFLGLAMSLQQSLFTQLPIPFQFPWYLLGTVLGFSMVLSVGASFLPIYKFMRLEVVRLFRIF